MNKQISFIYSRTLIRKAAKRIWLRYDGRFYVLWLGTILFALLLFLLSSNTNQLSYTKAFFAGILVGAFIVFLFRMFYSYESIEKGISLISKRLEGTELVYTFNEQGVSTEYAMGSANRFWMLSNRLWIKPDIWLLFYSDRTYLTLPTHLLDADLQQFIVQKVTEFGGKVEQ